MERKFHLPIVIIYKSFHQRFSLKQVLVSIILSCIISITGFSQKDSDTRITKWDFSLGTGGIIGGPCKPMYEKLLHSGVGTNWDAHTKYFPPVVFEVNRRINNYLNLGLNISMLNQDMENRNIPLGEIYHYTIIAFNPLVSYNYRNLAFFSAGPTINSIYYYQPDMYVVTTTDYEEFLFGIGFTVKSFLEYPKKTRVHLRLETQYSYGGTISPVYTVFGLGGRDRHTRITVPNLPVSYFYGGIGLGVRLFKRSK